MYAQQQQDIYGTLLVMRLQGFEWYDTMTSTILSNITFDNYKYKPYSTDPSNWWYYQTPFAFRMLSVSDQFKPGVLWFLSTILAPLAGCPTVLSSILASILAPILALLLSIEHYSSTISWMSHSCLSVQYERC